MNAIQTSLYFGAAIASSPTGDELGAVHGMHPVGAGSGGGTGLHAARLGIDAARTHVHSNRGLTRELDELGIEHEAGEFRGLPWTSTGRRTAGAS